MAHDGVEQYAFTHADGETGQSGEIPRTMDPRLFFGEGADGAETERSLLEAVAGEFGVLLPRHAIVNGRLHTFVARSGHARPGTGRHTR
ncbi:hypothetical protein [Streptomyces sp. AK010]|uniref:hypothetical protein n=1 Tax=Streptomyces sp. AK010 TaxID=2723074 RepID=UPI0017DC4754|nr:hypothetical protein [Streptomyces sp. AK010]MBB6417545.1 hypothetical protein [Streptomyces sp. AK010]